MPDVDQGALAEFVKTAIARGECDVYRRALEHFDRLLISSALQQANGQQNRAAEILGLSRTTLRTKLRNMQLSIQRVIDRGTGTSTGVVTVFTIFRPLAVRSACRCRCERQEWQRQRKPGSYSFSGD